MYHLTYTNLVRVLTAVDAGDPTSEVADTFAVSPAWVRRLVPRRRETGETAPRKARDTRVPKLRGLLPRIRELLAATPDMTRAELRAELRVAVALSTVWVAVRSLGLTVNKSYPGRRAGPPRCPGGPGRLAAGDGPGRRPPSRRVRR